MGMFESSVFEEEGRRSPVDIEVDVDNAAVFSVIKVIVADVVDAAVEVTVVDEGVVEETGTEADKERVTEGREDVFCLAEDAVVAQDVDVAVDKVVVVVDKDALAVVVTTGVGGGDVEEEEEEDGYGEASRRREVEDSRSGGGGDGEEREEGEGATTSMDLSSHVWCCF